MFALAKMRKLPGAVYESFNLNIIPPTYKLDVLLVAGGGAGGGTLNNQNSTGGGGAGGMRAMNISVLVGVAYTITVGGGGALYATRGDDSSFGSLGTATGGARGANMDEVTPPTGGSGGGGSPRGGGVNLAGVGNTPSTSPSQGKDGGLGYPTDAANDPGGGGGGGGENGVVGSAGSSTVSGKGGDGSYTAVSGGATTGYGQLSGGNYYFAGGGQGGQENGSQGGGGLGGGGTAWGVAGATNKGGGGAGGVGYPGTPQPSGYIVAGAGGSGIVIIRRGKNVGVSATGGATTTDGIYVYHSFISTGTFTA